MLTCPSCGTELPVGAMFCGECGRAITAADQRGGRVQEPRQRADGPGERAPDPGKPSVEPASSVAEAEPRPSPLVCEQCGAPMGENDIFCGECGHVSRTASEGFGSRDTVLIEPVIPLETGAVPVEQPAPRVDRPPRAAPPAPVVPSAPVAPPAPAVPPAPVAPPAPVVPSAPVAPSAPIERAPADEPDADLERTRIVDRSRSGVRFVLQFSTGESSTVYGTGLIGRNPRPEPGEYFDQLIRVLDPSRSVSKTHLEFGQEAGVFWVLDRYSGNGTVLREPDSEPVRCVPERRYRIQRGTRVEIGEQFFVVS